MRTILKQHLPDVVVAQIFALYIMITARVTPFCWFTEIQKRPEHLKFDNNSYIIPASPTLRLKRTVKITFSIVCIENKPKRIILEVSICQTLY